jgi:hypothetical protein
MRKHGLTEAAKFYSEQGTIMGRRSILHVEMRDEENFRRRLRDASSGSAHENCPAYDSRRIVSAADGNVLSLSWMIELARFCRWPD